MELILLPPYQQTNTIFIPPQGRLDRLQFIKQPHNEHREPLKYSHVLHVSHRSCAISNGTWRPVAISTAATLRSLSVLNLIGTPAIFGARGNLPMLSMTKHSIDECC